MTEGERLLIDDLNDFVRQTSDQIDEQETSSGIRPNPVIESTEQTLDTSRFGLEFAPQPLAEVQPFSEGGGGGGTPTGACCISGTCSDNVTESSCTGSGGVYQGDGSTCAGNPCCDDSGCPPDPSSYPTHIVVTGTYTYRDDLGNTHDLDINIDQDIIWDVEFGSCVGFVEKDLGPVSFDCSPSGSDTFEPYFRVQLFSGSCSFPFYSFFQSVVANRNPNVCSHLWTGNCVTSETGIPEGDIFGVWYYDCIGGDGCPTCPGPMVAGGSWIITIS